VEAAGAALASELGGQGAFNPEDMAAMLIILASDDGGTCSERNFLGDGGWRGRARPMSESLLPERRPHYRRDRRSDRHESRGGLHGVLPMTTGSVKFWNEDRGYGFLTTDDGDLFMHVSHWVEEDDPQPGESREFHQGSWP
jgi:cold shock CspA family protein